ncbi:MAG: glycosyltransferase family 39 protein [Chitinophagales bacterium]|nr:glycosyltransferase family 39 protein [Chitinophagales bacterium]
MSIIIFLIIVYTLLFAFSIYKCSCFSAIFLSKRALLIFFGFKAIVALFYIYSNTSLVSGGDIFNYYNDGLIVFDKLKQGEILTYLQLTFGTNNTTITPNIAQAVDEMGFWSDNSAYFIVRANAFINLFTFGKSIYINAVFFALFSFLASFFIYKTFEQFLMTAKNNILVLSIFLTPSLLYWTSGMHKETLSVLFISTTLYSFFKIIIESKIKFIILFILSLALLFVLRYFIALILIPPFIAFIIYKWTNAKKPLYSYIGIYTMALLSTYIIPVLFHTPNLVDLINQRKELYLSLKAGNTAIDLGDYHLSYLGYMTKIPQALLNTTVRPWFFEAKTLLLAISSIESAVLSIFLVASIFYIKKLNTKQKAFVYLFYAFGFSYLILTGLIVPNLGAILRYRSVALFLLVPTSIYILSDFIYRKN